MKKFMATAAGAGIFLLTSAVNADIFVFKDKAGFEACLRNDHLVESVPGGGGKQTKFLNKMDVQERCFTAAEKILSSEKNAKTVGEWIKTAQKNSHRDNSVGLIGLQVKLDNKTCNDSTNYDVFINIMDAPSSDDSLSLFQKAKLGIVACLKDKQFKTDFMDEQDSSEGSYRRKNVCDILIAAGAIKVCRKVKD